MDQKKLMGICGAVVLGCALHVAWSRRPEPPRRPAPSPCPRLETVGTGARSDRFVTPPPTVPVPTPEHTVPGVEVLLADPSAVPVTPLNEAASRVADHLLGMESVADGACLFTLANDVPGLRESLIAELGRRSRDGDTEARCRALVLQACLGDGPSREALLRRLLADPDALVRRCLARSLTAPLTSDPSLRRAMAQAIAADGDDEVRLRLIQSLPMDLSEGEVLGLLPRVAAERAIESREALVRVLGNLGGHLEQVKAEFCRIADDPSQPDRIRRLARMETLRPRTEGEATARR